MKTAGRERSHAPSTTTRSPSITITASGWRPPVQLGPFDDPPPGELVARLLLKLEQEDPDDQSTAAHQHQAD